MSAWSKECLRGPRAINRLGVIPSNADSLSSGPFEATSVRARRRHAFAHPNDSSKGWDVLAVIVIAIFAVAVPLAVSWRAGSLSIPRNDDWAYRRAALYFYETGHLRLLGWSVPTLVGQIFWLWPFLKLLGAHPWSRRCQSQFSLFLVSRLGTRCAVGCCQEGLRRWPLRHVAPFPGSR